MKETDDGKSLDGQDAGAVPATSTKTWADQPERLGPGSLIGRNVHGTTTLPGYYYREDEWSRSVGWGKVPPERKNMGVNQDRLTDESLQEDSDT